MDFAVISEVKAVFGQSLLQFESHQWRDLVRTFYIERQCYHLEVVVWYTTNELHFITRFKRYVSLNFILF